MLKFPKALLLTLAVLSIIEFATPANAQGLRSRFIREPIPTEYVDVGSTLVEPEQNPLNFTSIPEPPLALPILPEAPIAKVPASPCPAGSGKPCALAGGAVMVIDSSKLGQHDKSWGRAMRNPWIIGASVLLAASVVADIEETQACTRANNCKQGSLIFGASRAKSYGIAMPILAVELWMAGKLKRQGDGVPAMWSLWVPTVLHVYVGWRAYSFAHPKYAKQP